ncbi:MAG TPA: hypothetical protein VFP96_01985 [Candidatus Acidoferrum sp.]|nr:hypothetical protein [Candidatus Acidoferrum sp.]
MSCPICAKRKEGRFCPAKGEKICAVCCGTEREVSIDCPSDCAYLAAARRYEDEHKRQIPADTPFLEERIPPGTLHTHQPLMAALAFTMAKVCMTQPSATDPDVIAALRTLAESYKTLISGIYYEKLPDIPVQREIYDAMKAMLDDLKQKQAAAGTLETLKTQDIFFVVIFLFRMGLLRGNGRPRSRRFIEFLRGQFPQAEELKREEPRIILP